LYSNNQQDKQYWTNTSFTVYIPYTFHCNHAVH